MKISEKIALIAFIAIVFGLSIYLIRSILAPFIFSLTIAYFLHPLMDRLCKKRFSRLSAALLIIGMFFTVFIAIIVVMSPIVYAQSQALIIALPQYFQIVASEVYPKCAAVLSSIGIRMNSNLLQVIDNADLASKIFNFLQNFLLNAFSSSAAFINILSLIFITPILIFYLLKDWDLLAAKVHSYFPSRFAISASQIMREIDQALAGFVRGQISVCLILGLIYSILLSFAGLNFGFLIGVITGFLTFVPYVGALTGFVVAMLVAFFQWGFNFMDLVTIAMVFVFGQTLESNFLTPKLIGKNIGLHPVWIIFGLFVFGALFGFMGLLFATPLTAICGVLIRHLSSEYKKHIS